MNETTVTSTWESRLEQLYREHRHAVFAYARSRTRPHDADDIVAEVFVRAARTLRADTGAVIGQPWLIVVARNLIVDSWRRDRRRAELATRASGERAPTAPDLPDVGAAFQGLELRDRRVLVLRYVEGHTAREIADASGRTVAAVESTVRRARQRLAREYELARSV